MSVFEAAAPRLSAGCSHTKRVGDIVQIGPNRGQDYEILHIEGDTAWIRQPVTFRGETLIPLDRLRVVRPAQLEQALLLIAIHQTGRIPKVGTKLAPGVADERLRLGAILKGLKRVAWN